MEEDKDSEGDEPLHELGEADSFRFLVGPPGAAAAAAEETEEGGVGVDEGYGSGAEEGDGDGQYGLEEAEAERVGPEGNEGRVELAQGHGAEEGPLYRAPVLL